MECYTIAEPLAGRFRLLINSNSSRKPGWCSFDYAVSPAPGTEGVEIVIGSDADAETARWFHHLKRGIEVGRENLAKWYGRLLCGVRIEIRTIYSHPIDTTAEACEFYGNRFVESLGRGAGAVRCDQPESGRGSAP